MPIPQSVAELHRFLGMVAYLQVGKFIPSLSSKTSDLRKLLEKDEGWNWFDKHTQQFKALVTNSPVLKCFDPKLPIKVSVGAVKQELVL